MTRKINKLGWFVDVDTLDKFMALFEQELVEQEISFGHEYNIEDTYMVILVIQ